MIGLPQVLTNTYSFQGNADRVSYAIADVCDSVLECGDSILKLGPCDPELHARLTNEDVIDALVQRSLAKFEQRSRDVQDHRRFRVTYKRSELERNIEKHAPRGDVFFSSRFSNATRGLVNDQTRHILDLRTNDLRAFQQERGDVSEYDMFQVLPIDPRRIHRNSLQNLIHVPDGFDEFSEGQATLLGLLHRSTILKKLSLSSLALVGDNNATGRIVGIQEQTSSEDSLRVGIYQTQSSVRNVHGRKRTFRNTRLKVFEDKEAAVRSQQHALESLEIKRSVLIGIRATLLGIQNGSIQSDEAYKHAIAECIAGIEKKRSYWITRLRDNLDSLFKGSGNSKYLVLRYALLHCNNAIFEIDGFMGKFKETIDTIQKKGQFGIDPF